MQNPLSGHISRQALAEILGGKWVRLRPVPAQIYDHYLLRGRRALILVSPPDAREIRQAWRDVFAPPVTQRATQNLWRDACGVHKNDDLRRLRNVYQIRVYAQDVQAFRHAWNALMSTPQLDGAKQREGAELELNRARTEGTRALWQSVVDSFPKDPKSADVQPLKRAKCPYCPREYTPWPTQKWGHCSKKECCLKAERARDNARYPQEKIARTQRVTQNRQQARTASVQVGIDPLRGFFRRAPQKER